MKLPTDWQCRHIFPFPIFLGFSLMFLGIRFMDGWITWVGILLIVFTSIIFNFVLPEHGDPWRSTGYAKPTIDTPPAPASKSQREAAGTADEKPDRQAENS